MDAFDIWKRLEHRFNTASLAHALDLKHMLTSLSTDDNQSMGDYLQNIKTIANSLAAIQSHVSDLELIQYTTTRLQHSSNYDGSLTAYSMLLGAHWFDDLHSKVIFFEQRSKFTKDRDFPTHKAFAATIGQSNLGGGGTPRSSNSNNKGRNNGGRNKGTEVDIPKTIIETTIVSIGSYQVLLGIGVCL